MLTAGPFLRPGNYRDLVGPGLLHSATNYQLSKALWSSLNDANYFELAHCLERSLEEYRGLTLLEFVGNHDVSRLASRLKIPEHFELAQAALLLGVGGMPCLYYGDEWGMEGLSTKDGGAGSDADVRQPPPDLEGLTDAQARRSLSVSEMLRVRGCHPALSVGTVQVAAVSNGQLAIARRHKGELALVMFNCDNAEVKEFPQWSTCNPCFPAGTTLDRVLSISRGRQLAPGRETVKVLESGRLAVPDGLPALSVSVYVGHHSIDVQPDAY